ncbi:DUF4185 domain-containing protein [Mycobacterium sp. AMU20-3851]|uniref:DUF4185 domain-containing protein n=1 Tax=Mycobacterium sp. AMU20-3851 TaxID=3122055 RepID=UPI003753F04B
MGSAAYFGRGSGLAVGRVGGLAVALGVGTAIATGGGIAVADTTDSSTSSSAKDSSSSPAGSDSPSGAGSSDSKTDTGSSSPEKADDPDTGSDTGTGKDTGTESAGDAEPEASEQKSTKRARPTLRSADRKPFGVRKAARPQAAPPTEDASSGDATAPASVAGTAASAPAVTAGAPADPTDTLEKADKVAVFATAQALASTVTATVERRSTPIAVAPPNPVTAVVKVVSKVLDWAAGVVPGSPSNPTLAWTLLAFARREVDNLLSRLSPSHAASTGGVAADNISLALAAANARPGFPRPGAQVSGSTTFIDWVTGNFPPNDTFNRYGIWGTDIGTMWDNGIPDDPNTPINENQVLIAFGDTFGGPNMTGTWRLNTLFRSSDRDLGNGMTVPGGQWLNGNMFGGSPLWEETYARQIILPERLPRGLPTGVTLIPTAGISVPTPGTKYGATQYVSFMSVKQWGAAGSWTTNYSAIAYSEDNGENWYISPKSVRTNSPIGGNKNFQQAAFVRPGDGFVYSYGTPNGRQGQAYLSRVAEGDILDVTKYEYYSKGSKGGLFGIGAYKAGWYRNDPSKATPIFGKEKGACGVSKAGNQVSEMSVQYNATLGKYVAMHGDQYNNIILRTSDTPEGAWSGPTVVMGQQNGGIYAPMMHPWSPSTLGTGTDLYWNLSIWSEYNVMLMKTDLTKL